MLERRPNPTVPAGAPPVQLQCLHGKTRMKYGKHTQGREQNWDPPVWINAPSTSLQDLPWMPVLSSFVNSLILTLMRTVTQEKAWSTWNCKHSWNIRSWVKIGSCWGRHLWIIAPHKDGRCQLLACTRRAAFTWPDSSCQLGIAEDGDYEEEVVTVWTRGQKTQTQGKLGLVSSATSKPF